MKVTNLTIKNFRNYPDLDLDITSDMVVLSGPNAVGKTNLLESVYFASVFKSFRNDAEYIFQKGSSTTEVRVTLEKGGETHTLEVFLEQRDRIFANFRIDGVKTKRAQAQGFLRVVVFEPSDVDIFSRSPESRRRYLNMVLSQKSTKYLDDTIEYKKILAQRNKLLQQSKGNVGVPGLEVWNHKLVTVGSRIILARKEWVKYLNLGLSDIYTNISGFHRPVEVELVTLGGDTLDEITELFTAEIASKSAKEALVGTSLVGPHRDDFFLVSDGIYLQPFSSRGEQRSQILALKIMELEYLSVGEDKPLLLLDDVLSELDDTRRVFLLKYLQGKFQTFITTTQPLEMPAQHITLSPAVEADES